MVASLPFMDELHRCSHNSTFHMSRWTKKTWCEDENHVLQDVLDEVEDA